MSNEEYANNVILKIHHDSELNQLALLKCRFDCSVYIVLINLNDEATTIINIEGFFCAHITNNFTNDTRSIDGNRAYTSYEKLIADYSRNLLIIKSFLAFEVDFRSGHILLETRHKEYKASDAERDRINEELYCLVLNLAGEIVFRKEIQQENSHSENAYLSFFDAQTLLLFNDGYDADLRLWNFATGDFREIGLINNKEIIRGEISYEYIRSYAFHQQNKRIGTIFKNPTYGEDCIKIFDFDESGNLKLIFNYVFQDNRYIHLAFNPAGSEFSMLEYTNSDQQEAPNVRICTFTLDTGHIPKSIIDTAVNYHTDFIGAIRYYSEEVLCIVTHKRTLFYNLITGTIVHCLMMDDWYRDYHISYKRMFYLVKGKLTSFNLEEGEVMHYPIGKINDDDSDDNVDELDEDELYLQNGYSKNDDAYRNNTKTHSYNSYWRIAVTILLALWALLKLIS